MQSQNTNPTGKDDIKSNNTGDTSHVNTEKEGTETEKTHEAPSPKK